MVAADPMRNEIRFAIMSTRVVCMRVMIHHMLILVYILVYILPFCLSSFRYDRALQSLVDKLIPRYSEQEEVHTYTQ